MCVCLCVFSFVWVTIETTAGNTLSNCTSLRANARDRKELVATNNNPSQCELCRIVKNVDIVNKVKLSTPAIVLLVSVCVCHFASERV